MSDNQGMASAELRALQNRRRAALTMYQNAALLVTQIGNFGSVVDSIEISSALGFAHTTKEYLERVVRTYDRKVWELEERLGQKHATPALPAETGQKQAETGG